MAVGLDDLALYFGVQALTFVASKAYDWAFPTQTSESELDKFSKEATGWEQARYYAPSATASGIFGAVEGAGSQALAGYDQREKATPSASKSALTPSGVSDENRRAIYESTLASNAPSWGRIGAESALSGLYGAYSRADQFTKPLSRIFSTIPEKYGANASSPEASSPEASSPEASSPEKPSDTKSWRAVNNSVNDNKLQRERLSKIIW